MEIHETDNEGEDLGYIAVNADEKSGEEHGAFLEVFREGRGRSSYIFLTANDLEELGITCIALSHLAFCREARYKNNS